MRIELYGLTFETPEVTFYLWSPWRCSQLEHRLFESLRKAGLRVQQEPDEWRAGVTDASGWKTCMKAMQRVLKGWQEEAGDAGGERRTWSWLLEGDVDENGNDHKGEPAGIWGLLRLGLDRSRPGEEEKPEEIDLEGFGFCIWGDKAE